VFNTVCFTLLQVTLDLQRRCLMVELPLERAAAQASDSSSSGCTDHDSYSLYDELLDLVQDYHVGGVPYLLIMPFR
jgi:hypothetical protein